MEYKLTKSDDSIVIKSTDKWDNYTLYDSSRPIESYSRRALIKSWMLLIKFGELDEAYKLQEYVGKVIQVSTIKGLIPTGNYMIDTLISDLKDTIERYQREFNLELDPDFQRSHVWTEDQRVRYIEYLMQGGQTPPIYFNHEGWMKSFQGDMVIVDGKQRLTSLLLFLDNKLRVFHSMDPSGEGFLAEHFDYIPYTIKIGINDLPTRSQVLEWYLQMNSGLIAHTTDELDKVRSLLRMEDK